MKGFPAERVTVDPAKIVNAYLRGTDPKSRPDSPIGFDSFRYVSYGLYFVPQNIESKQRESIVNEAVRYLDQQPWITKAFSKAEILRVRVRPSVPPDEMSLEERFAESVDADRSPDILLAFKPYSTLDRVDPAGYYIAEHGSPWNYDRRVPIVFWRPGYPGYEQYLPIETVDIAPTLAALVDVPHPAVDGRCIDLDSGAGNTCPVN